ncbi:MAG: hypothetical protein K0V04_03950 [Deltaproteobacteria bacterium]|nr:hypothetical protein [Deltaproteobacteria bacterium]
MTAARRHWGWLLGLCTLGCAGAPPVGAERGVLWVGVELSALHLKSVEILHQHYEHVEAVTGFVRGSDIARQRVLAGPYCLRRLLFEQGIAGVIYEPSHVCFSVPAGSHTYLGTFVLEDGRMVLIPDGERLAAEIADRPGDERPLGPITAGG